MTYSGPAAGPIGGRATSGFRLGDTLQATFDAAISNFPVFFLLGLLLYALPALATTFVFGGVVPGASPPVSLGGAALRFGATAFVTSASNVLLQAAMARGVVTHLSGGKASFWECLKPALAVFLPLLAISLLASLGAALGFLLLVVPGLLLMIVWSVAAPAEVVERVGVFAAFGRSVSLTRGHRLAIFLVFFVVWLVAVVIQLLVGVPVQMLGLTGWGAGGVWAAAAVTQAVGGALGVVFTGVAPGAVYYELRRAKEGAAPAELAAVFD